MSMLLCELSAGNSTRTEQVLMTGWMPRNDDASSCALNSTIRISSRLQHKSPSLMAESNASGENRATTSTTQGLAFVLIARLQEWCRQLLWLTIFCVIGCCGDSITESARSKTIRHVRRNIRAQCTTTRMKSIAAIEMQLLCHLTQPHGGTSYKRRVASRAPSPQLYDISEEAEIEYEYSR